MIPRAASLDQAAVDSHVTMGGEQGGLKWKLRERYSLKLWETEAPCVGALPERGRGRPPPPWQRTQPTQEGSRSQQTCAWELTGLAMGCMPDASKLPKIA